jgi:transcriptional regulator with XRE-family HTH domain
MNIPVIALPSSSCGPYAPDVSSVGKNLKRIREERTLTQEQIAKQCGVPQNQWSKWESGKSEPKIKSLLRVAVALKIPLNGLVIGVNRDFDLSCQTGDQLSGRTSLGVAHDAVAARVDLQDFVDKFSIKAREVLALSDKLHAVAIDLEEIREASKGAASRRRGHRKAG